MATLFSRRPLSEIALFALIALLAVTPVAAQEAAHEADGKKMDAPPEKSDLPERILPADTTLTVTNEVTILGQRVPYRVTTGTQPVFGEDGSTIAALYYTFYERTDVADRRAVFIVVIWGVTPRVAATQ